MALLKILPSLISQGSFTGSFKGTSSFANKALTSSYLNTISQSLIPAKNNTYSLGTSTKKWKDIYVSTASIYFDNYPLRVTVTNNVPKLNFFSSSLVTVPVGSNPSTSSYALRTLTASYVMGGAAGTSGTSGGAGASGTSGTSGGAGAAGTSGTSGGTGAAGTSGTSGGAGASGTSGTSGTGSPGTSGTAGSSGISATSTLQTGSIAKQTLWTNVISGSSTTITGLSLSGNKWNVGVIEEWDVKSIPGDQYYNNVSILLHCNGTNGSTTFTDNSSSPKTMTVNGNAQISTVQSKFGGASGYFDGTGDYISSNTSNDFAFGTGDFTVECWMYSSDVSSATQRGIFQTSDTSGGLKTTYTTGVVLFQGYDGVGNLTGALCAIVGGTFLASSVPVVSTNTWYHIALVRYSGTSTLYVNGTSVASATTTGNCSGTYLAFGGYYSTSYLYYGYLDELRITKGVARYTGNFTSPTTQFLNNASVSQSLTKYVGTIGGLNDRSVDYGVQKLSDTSLKIVKMSTPSSPYPSGSLSGSIDRVYVNVLDYTNVSVTSSYARNALTASYSLNGGVGGGTSLHTGSRYPITASRAISSSYALNGNVNLNNIVLTGVTTGDAYYPQVSALLHFDGINGSTTITDNSKNVTTFTVNGNAQISTAQSKFGGASLYLDGTGDYISSPSLSDFSFGTGDFTVECWAYRISGTDNGILQISSTSGGLQANTTTNLAIYSSASGRVGIYANGTYYTSTAFTNTTNTWYHYAIVRTSGVTKFYFNGSLVTDVGTSGAITDTTNYTGTYLAIGGYYSTSYLWNGYIDELRITKGFARYSSNFTPSTIAFYDNGGDVGKALVVNSTATGVSVGTAGYLSSQLAKAWVNFNGTGTVAIRDSYNVSSITDNATGQYYVNFSTPMNNTNYAVLGTVATSISNFEFCGAGPDTVNRCFMGIFGGSFKDQPYVQVLVFSN